MSPSLLSRVAFVGGGNMARSLAGGLIARGASPDAIVVSEPQAALRESLAAQFGLEVTDDNAAAVRGASLVVLAVKPQVMREVCTGLAGKIGASATVVSIAAGITCAQIERWLGRAPALVRCMPNTPALLGAGATGLYATPTTLAGQRASAEALLSAVGLCVWIDDESRMDAVTAVSGSGPAYVFLLAEAMEAAGIDAGLPPDVARRLTVQTLFGAARMLAEGDEDAATLRQRVTSPNGTTQAALDRFEAGGFRALVREAVLAAERRGGEMSRALEGEE
jgi:pyrroline-5-carboxylate reductase